MIGGCSKKENIPEGAIEEEGSEVIYSATEDEAEEAQGDVLIEIPDEEVLNADDTEATGETGIVYVDEGTLEESDIQQRVEIDDGTGNDEEVPLPAEAITPQGNVRVIIKLTDGVNVDDALNIISNEILSGGEVDVNRRDDDNLELNITISKDLFNTLSECSVIESYKADIPKGMH